jgi:peptidoglycan/xylan/chitin deacetylase (PgdA/CDA1 family)
VGAIAAAAGSPQAHAGPVDGGVAADRMPAPDPVLIGLPGSGNQLALTVDDGTSVEVVAALAKWCADTGTRLTFFVNGVNRSRSVNAPALAPMVESGQVQLGNHTWSHPDITRIGLDAVADQIRRNGDFLRTTYGVDGTPYFRPPYGRHTADTDRVAADLGYTMITLWSTDIGDDRVITETQLVANAQNVFQPQQIVLAHANLQPITHCLAQLSDIINSHGLQTVTLADVFS